MITKFAELPKTSVTNETTEESKEKKVRHRNSIRSGRSDPNQADSKQKK